MKRFLCICLVFLLFFPLVGNRGYCSTTYKELYVSPVGYDSNTGSIGSPFKTLGRAKEEVRRLRASMTGDIIVYFREGVYELEKPIRFDEHDSGCNGFKVIYRPYQNEQVLISGGRRVTGWQKTGKNLWTADLYMDHLRQLYINGEKAPRSRFENEIVSEDLGSKTATLTIAKSQLGGLTPGSSELEIVREKVWNECYIPVDKVESVGSQFRFTIQQPSYHWNTQVMNTNPWREGDKVFLENDRAFLDRDNEWFFDSKTRKIHLYLSQGSPEDKLIVAPVSEGLITLMGSSTTKYVENIEFYGLGFSYSAWNDPSVYGYAGWQTAIYFYGSTMDPVQTLVPGAVQMENVRNIRIVRNYFTLLGASAINISNNGKSITIEQNVMGDICGSGIVIGNNAKKIVKWPNEICENISVTNNYITRIGSDYRQNVGVAVYFARNIDIFRNSLYDLPYTGISAGSMVFPSERNTFEISAKYNRIEKLMQELYDGGAIYTVGKQPGSEYAYNYIFDMKKLKAAIYHDETSAFIKSYSNVIEDINYNSWVDIWKSSIHNIEIYGNYSDTEKMLNKGVNITLKNNHTGEECLLSPEAVKIKDGAGLDQQTAALLSVENMASTRARQNQIYAKAKAQNGPMFKDVPQHMWFYSPIQFIATDPRHIMVGWNDLFGPYDSLTVEQFIKCAVAAAGREVVVPAGEHYSVKYNQKAMELGLIKPGEYGSYKRNITRAEMARIIVRALPYITGEKDIDYNMDVIRSKMTDFHTIKPEFRDYVCQAYQIGILTGGADGRFIPDGNLTRASAAAVIHALLLRQQAV